MPDAPIRDLLSEFDLRLTRTLETPPPVSIPATFRVPRPAYTYRPRRAAQPVSTLRFGVWTIRAAFAVLILAMLLFTPWALTRAAVPLSLEFLLSAEFVALIVWTSLHPHSIR